jgi:glycosyltransferase involved in cell wall biosynthesis
LQSTVIKPYLPRISFGMIVLNGEPFVRYNLRALYPFAHEIIVVEGAVERASAIATSDGHSIDATLETLHRFKAEEDPDNKLIIIFRNGFWDEKDAMSQAYAKRATGDYLWQVDADEFYLPDDMQRIITILHDDPTITQISFTQYSFWGSINYISDGWYMQRGGRIFHRLFKWDSGYSYVTHRPPTVWDNHGRDTRTVHWIDDKMSAAQGIYLYHYSLVFPKQVYEKSTYYQNVDWGQFHAMEQWARENFMALKHPFRVHNVYQYPSWLERFNQPHPQQINLMWEDILSQKISMPLRPTADIEALLNNQWYLVARFFMKHIDRTYTLRRKITRFGSVQLLRVQSLWKRITRKLG